VRENRPANAAVIAVIAELVDWLFDNSTIWVWEEDGAIQGFSAADPRFATGLGALGLLGWRRKRKSRVSLLGAS
jgi:hypothetical protein